MDEIEYLDKEGYPTDAALELLARWNEKDPNGAIDFMRSLWHYAEWGVSEQITIDERNVYGLEDGHRYVKMSTGGWSGNEELMAAFRASLTRRYQIVVTRRGGHYVLEYRKSD